MDQIRSRGAKAVALFSVAAMTATVAVSAVSPLQASAAETGQEQLKVAKSGLPAKDAPFDQTVAYFLWPYQWGTQNIGTTADPKQSTMQVDRGTLADVSQSDSNVAEFPSNGAASSAQGSIDTGEYGWKGPGTRPTAPNLKSLDEQIKLVKDSGMTYVKTSYFISPLNAVDPNCDQSKPGDCAPSTDLPDQVIDHILAAGLKPVIYFSQGNPDPTAVANPDPNQVYKTVPSFTKQQVKDTISHAIQKYAHKGIIWESFNEPESEEHWPGGNNAEEAKIQWIELDQFIGDTIQKYDNGAAYVYGNFSNTGKLNSYTAEMKAAHATATSGHGYWVDSPEGVSGPAVAGYDYMDSEFGCSNSGETSWSCGFSGIPKNSKLQGIWLIRELLAKDAAGVSLASPYRMVGYDAFSINEDNDPRDPGNVKTTDAYDIIKNITLSLKGYSYVEGSLQSVDGVYRMLYKNAAGKQKFVYWTADKPTLENYTQTKSFNASINGKNVALTASATPQIYSETSGNQPQSQTSLANLTAWKDVDGNVIQAHGGSVLKDGDTYYWVGQGAPDNVPTGYTGAGGVFANQWLYTTINMYKSKDLTNWKFANAVLSIDDANAAQYCDGNVNGSTSKVLDYTSSDPAFKKLVAAHPQYLTNSSLGCKIERPHILKNKQTGKYLIWAHWEGTVGYESSQLVAFESSKVDGKYQPVKWQDGQVHAQPKVNINGKLTPVASRDLSAWQDPDNGTGYIISSTEKVRLFKLNSTFTGIEANGSYQLPNISYREAPSLFKENGRYYMITSAQDYWDPTQTEYATTKNLGDPNGWSSLTEIQSRSEARTGWGTNNPSKRTYIGQPTYVLQYTDAKGNPAVMLLADDWNPLRSSTANVDTTKGNYVMTPISRTTLGTIRAPYVSSVRPMQAGSKPVAPTKVAAFTAVETKEGTAPTLPSKTNVTWSNGSVTSESVAWDAIPAAKYAKAGTFTVNGVISSLSGKGDSNAETLSKVKVSVTVKSTAAPVQKVPVYRVYNRNSGLHHYTTNPAEKNMLVAKGWRDENHGTSSFVTVAKNTPGARPVYREYNRRNGNHNWTLNKAEHDMLVRLGWKNEGIAWYTSPTGKNVYRLYNPKPYHKPKNGRGNGGGEHVYTTSYGEYLAVVRAGWRGEGIAWKSL